MPALQYVGSELAVFAGARNWKAYWSDHIRRYVRGAVLDVGAGLGATAQCLASGHQGDWTCLEPDPDMAATLAEEQRAGRLPRACRVVQGTIADVPAGRAFDTILYIDVLEHIEDDQAELVRAAQRLVPGGHLIVLSPAHPFLYSNFDKSIGHFRRYTKASLTAAAPPELRRVQMNYLDSLGMALSLGNRMLLRQGLPTPEQIGVWDRYVVPMSRRLDPWIGYGQGKTVVGVWSAADE